MKHGVGMHINQSFPKNQPPGHEALRLVLRHAKQLHRTATSGAVSASLPILRRLLAAKVLDGMSLPELHRARQLVRRKHILRTLAIEAGYPAWEQYRSVLTTLRPEQLEHFDILRPSKGYPNLWFSSLDEAQQHVDRHGGQPVRVGRQAVVFGGEVI